MRRLQDNSVIRKIRTSLVKGVLDRLDHLAQDDAGQVPRRFTTSSAGRSKRAWWSIRPTRSGSPSCSAFRPRTSDDPSARVSFDEYLARMPAGQSRIYYLGGPDLSSITKSPNLEIFRRKGIEVLFLTDPIDEFALNSLGFVPGEGSHLDRLGRPRSARYRSDDRNRHGRKRELGQGERLWPRARAVPSGARATGSARSASRSD